MKRIGLLFLAVVMGLGAVGMTGCSDDDDKLTAADIAGTYTMTKATTATGVVLPVFFPTTLILTSGGLVTIIESDGTYLGTFTFDDPDLVIIQGGDITPGVVSNGGKTITFTVPGEGSAEFTKS